LEKILEGQFSELSVEPLPVVRETGWKFRNVAKRRGCVPGSNLMVICEEDAHRAIESRRWFEVAVVGD
jgi:hypothetical protein